MAEWGRRRKVLRAFFLALWVCGMALWPTQDAAAEKLVRFRPIKNRPDVIAAYWAVLLAEYPNTPKSFDEDGISIERQASYAEVDINGDGVKELIVTLEAAPVCGSAGCSIDILQKIDGTWVRICGAAGAGPLRLVDIWDHGYRRIIESARDTMTRCGKAVGDGEGRSDSRASSGRR